MADIDNNCSNNMYCNRELNTYAPPLTMYDMQDMHDNYHESYALLDRARSRKKAKTVQYTPVLFGDLLLNLNKKKSRASKTTKLKILMDSGTSGTIISGKHIPKARRKKDEQTKWNTRGGTFNTKSKSKIYFRLPELDSTKDISHSLGFDRWDLSLRPPNSPTSDILC